MILVLPYEARLLPLHGEIDFTRRGGRVDEGDGLENRYRGNSIVGSNPTPSASLSNTPALYWHLNASLLLYLRTDPFLLFDV